MAYDFQVAVDAADPHPLADWWAVTLGWTVEPSNEDLIRSMVAQGFATEDDTTTYRGVLVWKLGAAIRHPETGRRVLFQQVPEPKSVKNRVHFDIAVDDIEATRAALLERGATFLHDGRQGPHTTWVTMADPEGNEFCISARR